MVGHCNEYDYHQYRKKISASYLSKAFKDGMSQYIRKFFKLWGKLKVQKWYWMNRKKSCYWRAHTQACFGNEEHGHTQLEYSMFIIDKVFNIVDAQII